MRMCRIRYRIRDQWRFLYRNRSLSERLRSVAMVSTHVRLPEEDLRRAKHAARRMGISLSEYIRRALAMQVGYERGLDEGRRERDDPRS
jgi:hypothetical protein